LVQQNTLEKYFKSLTGTVMNWFELEIKNIFYK